MSKKDLETIIINYEKAFLMEREGKEKRETERNRGKRKKKRKRERERERESESKTYYKWNLFGSARTRTRGYVKKEEWDSNTQ